MLNIVRHNFDAECDLNRMRVPFFYTSHTRHTGRLKTIKLDVALPTHDISDHIIFLFLIIFSKLKIDLSVNSKMDLVARFSIAAVTFREIQCFCENVCQLMSRMFFAGIHAIG
ncbi:hypothetical protein NPIL_457361 [Nephila pilipes]|uniref:Uncharacterized protein n=1 Tax=Nephila pilipes TaxID=299642 RepID=A0A8X6QYA1_NEPPI|nr:hypothetical protein NPIL_457361 [Nephila pilipes]